MENQFRFGTFQELSGSRIDADFIAVKARKKNDFTVPCHDTADFN